MEREYWVMMRIEKGQPAEYYVAASEYMPEDKSLLNHVEVFDGPYSHGDTAREVARTQNVALDKNRMTDEHPRF